MGNEVTPWTAVFGFPALKTFGSCGSSNDGSGCVETVGNGPFHLLSNFDFVVVGVGCVVGVCKGFVSGNPLPRDDAFWFDADEELVPV